MTTGNMSLEEARKILGDKDTNIPDDLLRRDIDTARFLVDIFFDYLTHDRLAKFHNRATKVENI